MCAQIKALKHFLLLPRFLLWWWNLLQSWKWMIILGLGLIVYQFHEEGKVAIIFKAYSLSIILLFMTKLKTSILRTVIWFSVGCLIICNFLSLTPIFHQFFIGTFQTFSLFPFAPSYMTYGKFTVILNKITRIIRGVIF